MKYTLQISEPCHENWSKMTPADQGKFCAVCQKNVYDFTNSSSTEINKFVEKNSNFCGRFTTQQLEKEYNTQEYSSINYKKIGAFLGIASALTITEPAQAQEPQILGMPAVTNVPKDTVSITKKIRGYVCFINEPYTNVKVSIPQLKLETYTNSLGFYEFDYDKIRGTKEIEMVFEIYGMEKKTISVSNFENSIDVDLKNDDNKSIIGNHLTKERKITVVGGAIIERKPSLFKRFINLFKRKSK